MDRRFYLDLAAHGLCMPIGADLVLHEYSDPEKILLDGTRLGQVIEQTAYRFGAPLAIPHMDLEIEKEMLLGLLGGSFKEPALSSIDPARFRESLESGLTPRMQAQADAIRYIAERTELLPVGMCIGPFSLVTRLVADPITPVAMAGAGLAAEDDEGIALVERALELGTPVIMRNIEVQIDAGAKAIFVAEPSANVVYFSPNQIESGSDIFERFVIEPNRRIKALLDARGADLIFHCCGELTDRFVAEFAKLDPAVLSLGSSRELWKDAALVPKTTVLYGNLPSKQFYSDDLITAQEVVERGRELVRKMKAVGHPFILGTECDVLSVPGCHDTILRKADAVSSCADLGTERLLQAAG
jgi:uroporphyrinogen-III decarboxylase